MGTKLNYTPRNLFRTFAIAEAVTWTLLLSGLAARALFTTPPLLLTVVGGIHGAVFLGYGVIAALVGVNQRWGFWKIVLGTALAIVPYATIPFERSVEKRGQLVGVWRLEHSGEATDDHWFDRLYRWFINRPALLAIVLVVIVVAIFSALIIAGPPGGWGPSEN
jgi:integral membrane protein